MRYSELFGRTLREAPRDEESLNARLLARAGYVQKLMAGAYTFLPLGIRVLTKIENIIREEMTSIGGQELLMPALHPKENWMTTGRWDSLDVLYKFQSQDGRELALGPTHEEIVVPLAKNYIHSYKDLPMSVYQIQTKYRNELRAKSGLLRGREFRMKDMYSFHTTQADLESFYEKVKKAYMIIFKRVGVDALLTEASGGTFSKFSHEYQVKVPGGEDVIYHCVSCGFCRNKEIIDENLRALEPGDKGECPVCKKELEVARAAEVGNIFQLKTKYSDPFKLGFVDSDGSTKSVLMGCYGIGTSRLMGTIAEAAGEEKGFRWNKELAPYQVQLLSLGSARDFAETVYVRIGQSGIEILYDDRDESAGVKLGDADLIGLPYRVVVSERTAKENKIELKARDSEELQVVTVEQALEILSKR